MYRRMHIDGRLLMNTASIVSF